MPSSGVSSVESVSFVSSARKSSSDAAEAFAVADGASGLRAGLAVDVSFAAVFGFAVSSTGAAFATSASSVVFASFGTSTVDGRAAFRAEDAEAGAGVGAVGRATGARGGVRPAFPPAAVERRPARRKHKR
ncbi:MAG: hypothetical protein IJN32_01480 [Thermoguttaceae bacterium]|nr:hypothetical protein [Thermoguttaceae bacterium]